MFETVAPEAFVPRTRRIFYETLPVSIAVHLVAAGAALASMIWNVVLPTQSPKMIVAYSLTQVPDPPPPPPPPPKPEPPKPFVTLPKLAPPPPAVASQIVAPTVIPDSIPEVVPPPPAVAPPPAPVPIAAPAVADAEGSAKGMTGGQIGGIGNTLGTPGGIKFGEDGRVYVDRSVKLPLKEVDHEFPHYPDAAKKKRLEGTCVVRYTVGKNGRIIDIAILNHAVDPMFDEETLNTIRGWRYRPMMMNGKPVEVVHEVEVNYQYIVR
ncbi:MAG TPA: energy transducer TonB [Thermoanaerobaculia bacterium]|jgi:TonB family protein|nr:energy transducer TonB [Thermoanaerobaculia bacterium]